MLYKCYKTRRNIGSEKRLPASRVRRHWNSLAGLWMPGVGQGWSCKNRQSTLAEGTCRVYESLPYVRQRARWEPGRRGPGPGLAVPGQPTQMSGFYSARWETVGIRRQGSIN